MRTSSSPVLALCLLCACGGGDGGGEGMAAEVDAGGQSPDAQVTPPPNLDADVQPPNGGSAVFAHSAYDLFKIDPDSKQVMMIGEFDWPDSDVRTYDNIGDIAIDDDGFIFGISIRRDRVYSINGVTAEATIVSELDVDRVYNGLSFLPGPDGGEILIGAALDGTVFQIDPATGAATDIGSYGDGIRSSGDLVFVEDFGIVATVTLTAEGTSGNDYLATIDPNTYEATIIGDTGVKDIWGLGFWGDQIYGFTSTKGDGTMVLIDSITGKAQQIAMQPDSPWWGAGVTTKAPVIVD